MGKLLELATHSINDSRFYGSQDKPSIKWVNNFVSKYLTRISVRFINNNKPFKTYNGQYDIEAKIGNKD